MFKRLTVLLLSGTASLALIARSNATNKSCPVPRAHTDSPRVGPRFIDHGDYVTDSTTGLLWQKDGDESGKLNYLEAAQYAAKQERGGMQGWRVPTREELATIFPATQAPFEDTKYTQHKFYAGSYAWDSYWTSELDTRLDDHAYVYHWYGNGGANNCLASKNFVYVRCVHDPVERKTVADTSCYSQDSCKSRRCYRSRRGLRRFRR